MSVSLNIYGHTYDGVEGIKAKDTNNDTRVFVLTEDASISSGNQLLSGVTAFGAAGKYTGTIPTKTVNDLTASGDKVTVPAGYYAGNTSKSVNPGTAGTPTATKGTVSNHAVSVTPSVSNTSGYITGGTKTGTAVTVSASELVSGNKAISANGTGIDVANYATVSVTVPGNTPTLQSKTATPTESEQVISPDSGYDALSSVTVGAIDSEYVGSGIVRRDGSDPNFGTSGNPSYDANTNKVNRTIVAPAGYYESRASKIIQSTPDSYLPTQAAATIIPTETAQTAVAEHKWTTGAVTVTAIPSDYVGSDITARSSTDLTASGATVTVPAGYYAESASKSIDTATLDSPVTLARTPNLTVNSETGLITASIPNSETSSLIVKTAGYISKDDRLAIKVSGSNTSQLTVQAAKTVTPTETAQTAVAAGKYTTGAVTVAAISSTYVGSGITTRSSTDLTASGATVTVPAGYYASQTSKSVASGSAGTPTASKGTVSNHSISVTPSVTNTTGYITGGTKTGTAVTVSVSELVSGTYSVTGSGTADVTNYASISVPSGTAGTPTATKGTVSNHSVSVTPSVTNTTGYITGSSKTGTAVTVSASELVSGNKAITESGTGIDVADYSTVSVNLKDSYTATFTSAGDQAYARVEYNNVRHYTNGDWFGYHAGDSLVIYCAYGDANGIYIDGTRVAYQSHDVATYTYTLPTRDIEISCSLSYGASYIYVTTVSPKSTIKYEKQTITPNSFGRKTEPTGTYLAGAGTITLNRSAYKAYLPLEFPSTPVVGQTYQLYIHFDRTGKGRTYTYHGTYTWNGFEQNITIQEDGQNRTITGYFEESDDIYFVFNLGTADDDDETETAEVILTDSGYDFRALLCVEVEPIPSQYVIPTGTLSINSNGTYDVKNYASASVAVSSGGTGTDTSDATLNSNGQLLSGVTAYAKGTKYTGTIPTKTSSDLTVSGATVTVPSGYYASQATKSVSSGSAGTPTATKGTVSNHSMSVTPSVTNTTGYITGGTKTGTAVTVSASELVSGNKAISANGTGIDVANYSTVSVSVPFVTYYTGSSAPSSSTGSNGDIYLKTS